MRTLFAAISILLSILCISGCGGNGTTNPFTRYAYALKNPGTLVKINLNNGDEVGGDIALTGNLRNIAFRSTDGQLIALGTDLHIYSVDKVSGSCTLISPGPLAIDGHNGGMTFQPGSSTIRFVSIDQHNYRIDSTTGTLSGTDTNSNIPAVGLAYHPFTGRYYMQTQLDSLAMSTDIASGTFVEVGASTVDLSGGAGLAIDPTTGAGYVVSNEGLFSVNLATGKLTLISGAESYDDIAIAP